VVRSTGAWGLIAIGVGVGQFALPFVLLLSRSIKRNPAMLAALGVLILVAHLVDSYWLVMPALPPGSRASWLDIGPPLAIAGATMLAAVRRTKK
jgi:hypothetical protein